MPVFGNRRQTRRGRRTRSGWNAVIHDPLPPCGGVATSQIFELLTATPPPLGGRGSRPPLQGAGHMSKRPPSADAHAKKGVARYNGGYTPRPESGGVRERCAVASLGGGRQPLEIGTVAEGPAVMSPAGG